MFEYARPLNDLIEELRRILGIGAKTAQRMAFHFLGHKAYEDGFYATDDAALVERTGGRVRIIAGSPFNIKVTTPEDLKMVEYLLRKEQNSS